MIRDPYVRAAAVVRVIDGDTALMDIDLGFYVRVRMSCRLAGINAPEHNEPGGPEARTALAAILGKGAVTVESVRADKYAGRFDAQVVVAEHTAPGVYREWNVNAWLVEQGYAVSWDGTGPRPAVPWPPDPERTTT